MSQQKKIDEAQGVVDTVSRYVNCFGADEMSKLFVERMSREHRTLQQAFTRLCFMWIQHLAKLESNHYDLRNEASVKAAKKIMSHVDEYDLHLPTI